MTARIRRRELLEGAARGAGWLGLAPFALELPGGDSPLLSPVREPLRKCISLGGFGPLTVPDGHPNDYRLYGNREYIRDVSGTRWVKLWVSWAHLQEELEPTSREHSWAHLNTAPAGEAALRRLDRQVRAINDDSRRVGGMGVIVTLYHAYPTWSSGALPGDPARQGKSLETRVPDDVSADSPWAWFVSHLLARYRRGAPANPSGPSVSGDGRALRPGNPDGAWIDALEICNEPNLVLWPQRDIHRKVAKMIRTATRLTVALGGPALLAPATSDFPDHPHETPVATDWRTFSRRLLAELDGFRPHGAYVGWSHHNFLDVKEEVGGRRSRARGVVDLLYRRNWRGGGDRRLWLTEGGYDLYPDQAALEERLAQARKIRRNFAEMQAVPGVWMWTQHTICDVPWVLFKSGLRDDFVPGLGPGPGRPAYDAWASLPGSRRV